LLDAIDLSSLLEGLDLAYHVLAVIYHSKEGALDPLLEVDMLDPLA